MRFQEKLRKYSKKELWDEYCGFLTLKPEEFMRIQRRLLQEQMELWSSSALGQSILKGKYPRTIEEFRQIVPLTTYEVTRRCSFPGRPNLCRRTLYSGFRLPGRAACIP